MANLVRLCKRIIRRQTSNISRARVFPSHLAKLLARRQSKKENKISRSKKRKSTSYTKGRK